ncbi:MAG: alanine racemase [bacterium]
MTENRWRARALIDACALRRNLATARRLAPACKVMAVIKSNAYGHGIEAVVGALSRRVDAFAVATAQEGIACRALAPATPITLLSGPGDADEVALCQRERLDPVVHTSAQVEWLAQYDGAPLTAWLKIDTGMGRLGLAPAQASAAIAKLRRNRALAELRLMSHLANADDADDDFSTTQQTRFQRIAETRELACSLANSAGVMRWPQTHLDWVRPGIMLYGASPLRDARAPAIGLRPAMRLQARLLAIKHLAAGQPVGYGGAFVTAAPTRLGVVGYGYGDGYPRFADDASAAVQVGSRRAPIIGRISMDLTAVDLTAHDDAVEVGDEVTLWGDDQLGVDEVAQWANTIAYDLLCRVGARVLRVAADSDNDDDDNDD